MKKLLAMVLALVMTLSLCTVTNAFADDKDINEDYAEAVDTLNGMGVFKGYEDGSFKPNGNITRAEVAAIIYRLYTGDVKDKQAGLYAGYGSFSDMAGATWAAGYVGYCANAGFVKGYGNGKFGPSDPVTGYQALAMILRAVGYGKNGEFEGADWELHVAQIAQQLKVLKNVKAVSLKAAASRELVAELLFQVAAYVDTVTYTPAFGYVANTVVTAKAETLGEKNFKLDVTYNTADKWGRPSHTWYYNTGDKKTVIADKPDAVYTVATTECQIAADIGLKDNKTFKLITNGVNEINYTVQPLDTKTVVGAQGRLVEVYDDAGVIVAIDTYLAKVTGVKDAKFDKNGHLKTPATLELKAYADYEGETLVLTNGEDNYDYAVGDMLLINTTAYTNAYTNDNTRAVRAVIVDEAYTEIVGLADAIEGAQTIIWYNAAKHTVNGTTYDDACQFNHDEAVESTANYTWYFDQYGNLIGSFEIAATYSYGVITKMWWSGDSATGDGKALANVIYMDGTTNTVTVNSVDIITAKATPIYDHYGRPMEFDTDNKELPVATNADTNAFADENKADIIDGHLFRMFTKADGSVDFVLVSKLTVNGSAHAEVSATVANKAAYIGNKEVRVDTATLFLTFDGDKYATYTGINEVPSFTKEAVTVDYVLGSNGVAKYVYIIGTSDSAVTKDYVLITNNGYNAQLRTSGGVSFWEVNLYTMEGLVTVKTKDPGVKNTLTNSDNVNKLYFVTYTDGYATKVDEVTNTPQNFSGDVWASKIVNAGYENNVVEADTFYGEDYRWNVTETTVVVGELAADMSEQIVYILYTDDMNAQKIYIIDVE